MSEKLSAGTVVLPSVVDLRTVETLKADLLAVRGGALRIDASVVERLGGLGLQLLVSAVRTWKTDGQDLTFVNVTEAFKAQWQGFGAPLEDVLAPDAAA